MKANWFRRFLLWQVCLFLIWIIPYDLFSQTAIQTNSLCTGARLSIINNPQRIKKIEWYQGGMPVHTWTRDHQVVAGIPGNGTLNLNTLPGPMGLLCEPNGALTVGEYVSARVIQFPPGAVSGTAGTIVAGGNGGGTALNQLSALDLARDAAGNLYIPDVNNYRVLKFPPGSNNTIFGTIVAGTGAAGMELDKVNSPAGIAVDAAGFIYVSDRFYHRVLRFPPGSTEGTTGTFVAGGNGAGNGPNQLNTPYSIRLTANGDLLIADAGNHRIMRWTPGAPTGTIVAGGNGAGAAPDQLNQPRYFYEDSDHNLYVSDQVNHRVQLWAPGATEGITVAGGYGAGADPWQLSNPLGITLDAGGNIYVAAFARNTVVKFAPAYYIATQADTYHAVVTFEDDSQVTTGNVTVNNPGSFGVSIHASTNTFIPGTPITFTPVPINPGGPPAYQWKVNGNNTATGATFTSSTLQEGDIVTCDMTAASPCTFLPETRGSNSITLKAKKIPGLTASSNCNGATLRVNTGVPITKIQWYRDNVLIATADTTRTIRTFAGGNGTGSGPTQFNHPMFVYHHTDGYTYVSDLLNQRVLKYPSNATSATPGIIVAGGNGLGAALNQFNGPAGLAFDRAGYLYVSDAYNYRVLKFPPNSDGATLGTVVAGGNGFGDRLNQLKEVYGIEVDAAGNLYVADYDNRRVLRFPPGSASATYGMVVAGGNGVGAALNQVEPGDLALDNWGNLYLTDVSNTRIVHYTPGATSGTLLAGGNGAGTADNQVNTPWGLARDPAGNLYVAESLNQRVRVWKPGATNGQYWAGPGGLGFLHSLDVDSLGNTWIVDRLAHRIQYYELTLNRELIATQGGTYKAVITHLDGTLTTTTPDRVILPDDQPAVSITAAPATFIPGNNITFTALPQNGGASPAYQWKVNDVNVATGPTFSSTTLQEGDVITCALTAPLTCSGTPYTALSNGIRLKEQKPPSLTATNNCTGGTLKVNSRGPIVKIEWYRDNVLIQTADTTRIPTTFAGGQGNGTGLHQLSSPKGLARDKDGNIYVADELQPRILKFPPNSLSGTPGTIVAGGNGVGNALNQFRNVHGVALDTAGNLYVADFSGSSVLKFPPNSTGATFGTVAASGNGAGSGLHQLQGPAGVAVDAAGNVYVADWGNLRVLRFPPGATATTQGTIVAGGHGNGPGLHQLTPSSLAVDDWGNVYAGDERNNRVVKWAPGATSGIVVAGGNGMGINLNQTSGPLGLALDPAYNLYVTDLATNRATVWTPGAVTGQLWAGTGLPGGALHQLTNPLGIIVDSLGNTWIADRFNYRIQHYSLQLDRELPLILPGTYKAVVTGLDGIPVTTTDIVIGDSRPRTIIISTPYTTVVKGTPLTFTAAIQNGGTSPQLQWKVNGANAATGTTYTSSTLNNGDVVTCELTTVANTCAPAGTVLSNAISLTIGDAPTLAGSTTCPGSTLTVTSQLAIQKIEWYKDNVLVNTTQATWNGSTVAGGNSLGTALNQFNFPYGLFIDPAGNRYVADYANHRVLKFPPNSTMATNGIIVAGGNGPGNALNQLQNPAAIVVDGHGYLYVSDYSNQRVLKFPPNATPATNGEVVAGNNGPGGSLRQFRFPNGLCLDGLGYLYVADRDNNRVLRFPPGSTQTTDGVVVAGGNGPGAGLNQLNAPNNVSLDAQDNLLISEIINARVVRWTPGALTGTIVAGGNGNGPATNQLNYPNDVIADIAGNLYTVERANNRVMLWAPGATNGIPLFGGQGAGPGQLFQPAFLRRDGAGRLHVTEIGNHRVQQFTPSLTPTYTAAASGTYKAVVTTIDGQATTTADVVIDVQQTPAVTIATPQTSICAGKPVTFTATPTLAGTAPTYQWKLNGGDVTGTGNTYNASTLANGDIISCVLTVSADAGCVSSATATSNTVMMTILNAPVMAPITGTTTLCAQGTTQLTNLTLNATGAWKSLSPAVATVDASGLITGVAAGTAVIRYVATSSAGCIDSIQSTITVQPLHTPTITVQASATTVCAGASVQFTASGHDAGTTPGYAWQVNGLANGVTGTSFTSNTLQQDDVVTCVLTAGTDAGCVTSATATSTPITLTVNALPRVRPITGPATLCTNGTSQLINTTPGITGQWKSLDPLIATVGTDGIVTGHLAGNARIRFIAATPAGCQDSTELLITVHPSVDPAITIQATYYDTCAGAPIQFNAQGIGEGTQPAYQWQVNGMPGGNGTHWTSSSLKNGDRVTCVLTSNATCASSNTVTATPITLTIYPVPTVDAGPDKTIVKGDVILLEGKVTGTATVQWTPATRLQPPHSATPMASPATTTTYRLEASTDKGCTAADEVMVTVLPAVRIPNAFSPNGDGIHDTWELADLRHFPQAEIQVFNRYGQAVYSTRGYQPGRGWNGTVNGYILPAGAYYYVIDLKNGKPKLSGSVTLIK